MSRNYEATQVAQAFQKTNFSRGHEIGSWDLMIRAELLFEMLCMPELHASENSMPDEFFNAYDGDSALPAMWGLIQNRARQAEDDNNPIHQTEEDTTALIVIAIALILKKMPENNLQVKDFLAFFRMTPKDFLSEYTSDYDI